MSKRIEFVNMFYNEIDEDARLNRSRHGQLEYITTMNYIKRFAKKGSTVLEVGAGTGRYSIALAKEDYDVTAVELVEHNLEILKRNSSDLENIKALQGDALDLSRFADETFDITLVLGPLYHLYEKEDVKRALDEAIRVTKKDGVIFVAFLSAYAIIVNDYLNADLAPGLKMNFTEDYKVKHFEEQLFTGYDIVEFEMLFEEKEVCHLTTVATDSVLEFVARYSDFSMSDEEFEAFTKYHLATCEKRELLGCSSHLLYVCKRNR